MHVTTVRFAHFYSLATMLPARARKITLAALAMLIVLGGCQGAKEQLEGDGLIVLEGATLIDGTGSAPRPDAVVVIDGTKILRVGDMEDFGYPAGARILNVGDRWLVPGFIDTHAHLPEPRDQAEVMKTLLAFGITTLRAPGAEPSGTELRDQVGRGEVLGPRILTAGNLIDAPGGIFSGAPWVTEVGTEQEARAEVKRQVGEGVDLIKVYRGLPPSLVQVVVEEAHQLGRPVLGHLGKTTWGEAASMGIDGVSHFGIFGTPWELVPKTKPF